MISLRARLVRFLARQYFRRVSPERDLGELRQSFEDATRRLRTPGKVSVRHASIAGIDCDWLVPEGSSNSPVLLYLHGGAYVMGSSKTHRHMVATIAKAAGIRAVLPNYRLAPEHPFPQGIDDACAVYRQLLEQGIEPAQIVIAGDSAGGGLTTATALKLRDAGDPLPAALVLLSPWLDLSASGESIRSRARLDPLFRPADMPAVAEYYCAAGSVRDPLVSPVFADARGLPSVFIQVGDHEILLSDSTRFADALSEAGSPVTLQVWPGMWHVFQFFGGKMPEADRALADIASFLKKTLA
jgi:epsilon-lactone hydrolase